MRVMKHWNGCLSKALEPLSLKRHNLAWQGPGQPHGFKVGCNYEVGYTLSGESDHMTSKDLFQPKLFHDALILSQ